MRRFRAQGIVREGRLIIEVPADLPDGTVITVTGRTDDGNTGPTGPPSPEVAKNMILGLINRPDLLDDPDWRVKIGVDCE